MYKLTLELGTRTRFRTYGPGIVKQVTGPDGKPAFVQQPAVHENVTVDDATYIGLKATADQWARDNQSRRPSGALSRMVRIRDAKRIGDDDPMMPPGSKLASNIVDGLVQGIANELRPLLSRAEELLAASLPSQKSTGSDSSKSGKTNDNDNKPDSKGK